MEQYLRDLGHARDCLDRKVAEAVDGPRVLISFDEATAIWRISEEIESKLCICFNGVDATREKKPRSRFSVVTIVKEVRKIYL